MTVKEIVTLENKGINRIFLHAEGIFYRLYNQSAFWWHDHIKPFKLNLKFVKTINTTLVSIGFPKSKWAEYKDLLQSKGITRFIEIQDDLVGFECKQMLNEEQTQNRITRLLGENKKLEADQGSLPVKVLNRIKDFPLANKTPFEAMGFLSDLQKFIQEK